MNNDQSAMCYVSMDSFQQSLQTNGKLFFKLVFELLADDHGGTIKEEIPCGVHH